CGCGIIKGMLDDAKFVSQFDKSNALSVVAGQPNQLKQPFEFNFAKSGEIKNLVVAGMGGSALAAEFVGSWLADRLPVPLTICRDYKLPASAGPETLAVISSYSGNTEETLACLDDAQRRRCQIVVMTSGGKLAETAKAKSLPLITVPTGLQPRLAVLFGVKGLSELLSKAGLVQGLAGELAEAADWLADIVGEWTMESGSDSNIAKQIASELFGFAAVIYSGPTLAYAARKW